MASAVSGAPRLTGVAEPACWSVQFVPSQLRTWVHCCFGGIRDQSGSGSLHLRGCGSQFGPQRDWRARARRSSGGLSAGIHLLSSKRSPGATFAPAGLTISAEERARPSRLVMRS